MRFVSFPLPGTMDLLGHKLLIISWINIITGILITSKEKASGITLIAFGILQEKITNRSIRFSLSDIE